MQVAAMFGGLDLAAPHLIGYLLVLVLVGSPLLVSLW
jgi:hypothetical protein